MKPLTLEYIAGFIDGEGSFMISKALDTKYYARFSVSNTNLQILQDIQRYFTPNLKIYNMKHNDPKRKPAYDLRTSNADATKSIAILLLPHLRIKKEQAEIIIQFPRARPIHTARGSQSDYSTKALQAKLYKTLQSLNKKGPANKESDQDPQLQPDPQLSLFEQP